MQIQSNIPLPVPRQTGGYYKYKWDSLNVGDSFFVQDVSVGSMSSVALRAGRRRGHKYTCRSVEEDGQTGIRVWRVK